MNETLVLPYNSRQCFGGTPLSNFGKIETSGVDNFFQAFYGTNFDYDVSDWNVSRVQNFTQMFFGTSMSVVNCDNIFLGWQRWDEVNGVPRLILLPNMSIHMGNTDYTRGGAAEDAFNYLVNTLNWTIIFG